MKKLVVLTIIMLSGVIAMPQTTTAITKTQKHQTRRIKKGVASGELTKQETHQLVHQQKLIQLQKRMAKADGVVTKKERARINHNQAKASSNIYRKKHNAFDR